ncbi:hypothetical protein OTU49_000918 [Cherax quadricarinatus]|uniref:Protein quiver n=1 Tax=Cherax quadricarinatus TaxID=27406 RepID=A0AAW0XVS6_CHEQU
MTPPTPPTIYHLLVMLLSLPLGHKAVGIRCVQCVGDVGRSGETCITKPPAPAPCDPSMTVCMTIRTYTPAQEDTRTLVSLVRTCAPTDMGWDCERGKTERGVVAEVCHDSCGWDGCNHAHATTPTAPTLLFFTVLGCLWAASLLL